MQITGLSNLFPCKKNIGNLNSLLEDFKRQIETYNKEEDILIFVNKKTNKFSLHMDGSSYHYKKYNRIKNLKDAIKIYQLYIDIIEKSKSFSANNIYSIRLSYFKYENGNKNGNHSYYNKINPLLHKNNYCGTSGYFGVQITINDYHLYESWSGNLLYTNKKYIQFSLSEAPACCGLAMLGNFTKGSNFKWIKDISLTVTEAAGFSQVIFTDKTQSSYESEFGCKKLYDFENKRNKNKLGIYKLN